MAEDDPLTKVYDGIWALLEADTTWASMVAAGNRIKFSGSDPSPKIDQALDAGDRPQVQLHMTSLVPPMWVDSSNSKIIATFELFLLTGDQRYSYSMNPLIWETYRALHNYVSVLRALTWGSHTFVKRVQSKQVSVGLRKVEDDNKTRWLSAVWGTEVEMWFPKVLICPTISP